MKIKSLITLICVSLSLVFVGCHKATLQPGGAYAPAGQQADLAFYYVDSAFELSYSIVDTAFKMERDNRDAFYAISPEIKHTLDLIRPQATKIIQQYSAARAAYVAHPTPTGLSDLQLALATVQKLAATAAAAIPKGN
jgi:hypothetical protein